MITTTSNPWAHLTVIASRSARKLLVAQYNVVTIEFPSYISDIRIQW